MILNRKYAVNCISPNRNYWAEIPGGPLMLTQPLSRSYALILLLVGLLVASTILAGCSTLLAAGQPAQTPTAPQPTSPPATQPSVETAPPNLPASLEDFKASLLQ